MTETQQPTMQERDRDWRWDDPLYVIVGHPEDADVIKVPFNMTILLHPSQERGVVRSISRLEAIAILADHA